MLICFNFQSYYDWAFWFGWLDSTKLSCHKTNLFPQQKRRKYHFGHEFWFWDFCSKTLSVNIEKWSLDPAAESKAALFERPFCCSCNCHPGGCCPKSCPWHLTPTPPSSKLSSPLAPPLPSPLQPPSLWLFFPMHPSLDNDMRNYPTFPLLCFNCVS